MKMKGKPHYFVTCILLLVFGCVWAQDQKEISGTVSDEDGMPIPQVNVIVEDSDSGTYTDFDGNYEIQVESGKVLRFSAVGFEDQTATVGDESVIDIVMRSGNLLDEVVVVGYGTQKKSEVTGAISQIKGSDIQGKISSSFESQLAGRAAGVEISSSAVIGEAPKVNIRGIASINSGTQPLYIVDGVPYNSAPGGANVDVNPLADLNPNDIESFEILKDGAASAIYGSRAANGVVLITTKRGKKNDFEVNFSSVTGFGTLMKGYSVLGTDDFIEIMNEKSANNGESDWAVGSDYNTDWQKEVLRRRSLQINENLSLSGGTEKGTYFLSLGYGNQEGASIDNKSEKYNFRAAIEQEFSTWLKAGASIAYTKDQISAMNKGSSSLSGYLFNALQNLPNIPYLDPDSETGYNFNSNGTAIGQWDNNQPVGSDLTNIMYVLENNSYHSSRNRNVMNGFAEASIIDGLKYRFQLGYDYGTNHERMFWNPVHGDGAGSNGVLAERNYEDKLWNVQNILSYDKSFDEKHNLGLTAVAEFQEQSHAWFSATGRDISSSFFDNQIITDAFGEQEIGGGRDEQGLKSFIGRASYNFDRRYFAQASVRRDGLSNLSEDNRWETFWGGSVGWTIANEGFWEELKGTVNDFKVRLSYAETGNTNIGNYPYLGLYGLNKYGEETGYGYSQFGNDRLVWETTNKTNVGVDLGFLKNRITFTAEYFQNDTKDMIMNRATAPSLGVPNNYIKINAGNMKNSGLEFDLSAMVVDSKDWSWNTGVNVSFSKNSISNLPNGEDIFPSLSNNSSVDGSIILREGESINSLYGFEYWGVNPANGAPVYVKEDGSLVQTDLGDGSYYEFDPDNPDDASIASSLADADRKILGRTTPTYFGGWHNTVQYKNFDLSFIVRFSGGNKVYNLTRKELMGQEFKNNLTEIKGRWQSPDNPGDGQTPKLVGGKDNYVNGTGLSSRFVESGDYVSLDNITLGYNFSPEVLERIKIKSLRVYVSGQNLFMITPYKGPNPEGVMAYGVDEFTTPKTSIWALGVNLSL